MGNALQIRSIRSLERLSGMTVAWPVLMQDCAKRWHEFRNYATSSGTTFGSSVQAKSSTRVSRRRTAFPTSSNSPNSCAATRYSAQSRAEGTFGWRAKHPTVKRNVTMNILLTQPPGNGKVQDKRTPCTKNHSASSMSRFRKGVTSSHESHTQSLAAAKRKRHRQLRQLSGEQCHT